MAALPSLPSFESSRADGGGCLWSVPVEAVQDFAGVVYFCQRAVDLVCKITAQRQQLLGGGFSAAMPAPYRKRVPVKLMPQFMVNNE